MIKKRKGFTLIELLAIIVILAIIAVITVPIILNVIDNAKKGTVKDSAYGYKDAISKNYVSGMMEQNDIILSGNYTVNDGKLGEYDIPFSGTKPTSGYLTYDNNVLTSGCLTIDDYKVEIENGEVKSVENGECTRTKGYICKRADVLTLHTEECTQTTDDLYCKNAGYTTTGIKGTTTITYGNQEVTQGTLTSGDAFDCDVNGDGKYNSQTERFYYVSDLFNTTRKAFDDDYAVLIYYNNTTNGLPDNSELSRSTYYASADENWHGPIDQLINLPTVDMWKNVSLSNTSRAILNQNGETTTGNDLYTLPNAFNYEGYSTRLLTVQEINSACNITSGSKTKGELDSCIYLIENTRFSNPDLGTSGYWLENAKPTTGKIVWIISAGSRFVNDQYTTTPGFNGTRPVIEVLKSDIEY